jgi:predicted transcriptional regulator
LLRCATTSLVQFFETAYGVVVRFETRVGRISLSPLNVPVLFNSNPPSVEPRGFAMSETSTDTFIDLAADIVSAYVSNNQVAVANLPGLIAEVHGALSRVAAGVAVVEVAPEPLKPAVPVKKSINPDFIVCLEDGKKFKSLKRHLRTQYNMTPDDYRTKWGLPADYPMVAPAYAEARSNLARKMGLGQQRRRAAK